MEGEEEVRVHTPSKTKKISISLALSAISLPISIGMTSKIVELTQDNMLCHCQRLKFFVRPGSIE
jgi:hypothetical protein